MLNFFGWSDAHLYVAQPEAKSFGGRAVKWVAESGMRRGQHIKQKYRCFRLLFEPSLCQAWNFVEAGSEVGVFTYFLYALFAKNVSVTAIPPRLAGGWQPRRVRGIYYQHFIISHSISFYVLVDVRSIVKAPTPHRFFYLLVKAAYGLPISCWSSPSLPSYLALQGNRRQIPCFVNFWYHRKSDS